MVQRIMEGAARVFAGEFSRSTLFEPSGDSGTPGWVVTPGGAYCRQVFLAGVLTEIIESGEMLRCRVADPTGAFDIVSWRNGGLNEVLRMIQIPSFVAVTGIAQMYQNKKNCSLTIRPEQILSIDRAARDQILLSTAGYTLHRLGKMHLAVRGECSDEKIKKAARHYAITPGVIHELVQMVECAVAEARSRDPVPVAVSPDVMSEVRELIRDTTDPQGIAVEHVIGTLTGQGIRKEAVLAALESLIVDDECYQPRKGYVRLL
jgi:RPA family protein